MNGRKGVIAGISAVVTTSIAVVIGIAGGLEPTAPILIDHGPVAAGLTAIVFGLPVAAVFGGMLGALTIDVPRYARVVTFIVVSLAALGLCLPFWPGLAPFAVPVTIVHAMALARWTSLPEPLPRAIVRRPR